MNSHVFSVDVYYSEFPLRGISMAAKPAKKQAKKVVKKVVAKKPAKAAPKAAKPAPKAAATTRVPKVRVASRPKSGTGAYTQSEFLENFRAFCGLEKRSQAKEMVEDISTLIKDTLRRGYKIPLFGLGKMYVRSSKSRMGRNPQTGAEIKIPARKRVRFAAAKALKEAVL